MDPLELNGGKAGVALALALSLLALAPPMAASQGLTEGKTDAPSPTEATSSTSLSPSPTSSPSPSPTVPIRNGERSTSTTHAPTRPAPAGAAASRRPCICDDGQCTCCTGALLQNFVNFTPRQKGCLNISYDPDDFAFGMALSFNDRVVYKNAISAKNPRPLCVPIPRITSAKLCVKLSNVYFVGRNLHACIDMEAKWQNSQGFQMSFDCIRIGADGVKVVKPEDGSGLPLGVPVGVTPSPDEYDEIPDEHPPENNQASTTPRVRRRRGRQTLP